MISLIRRENIDEKMKTDNCFQRPNISENRTQMAKINFIVEWFCGGISGALSRQLVN